MHAKRNVYQLLNANDDIQKYVQEENESETFFHSRTNSGRINIGARKYFSKSLICKAQEAGLR